MNTPPITPKRKRPTPKVITTSIRNGSDEADPSDGSSTGSGSLAGRDTVSQILQSQVMTDISVGSEVEDSVCGSPRTQVASRLNELALRGPRTKTPATLSLVVEEIPLSDQAQMLSDYGGVNSGTERNGDSIDVQRNRKRTRRISGSELKNPHEAASDPPINERKPGQITPPPEHGSGNSKISSARHSIERNPSPPLISHGMDDGNPKVDDKPLDHLTWHDSEITGHLGLDPDDDGTGINGVGFRPTPQQIYARSQRRKQQLREWRERESREERKRRYERRGQAISESASGNGDTKDAARIVRFA